MAYLRYSGQSHWYVFDKVVEDGAESQLAMWHRDHRSSGPAFLLSDVRSMVQSNELTRIPGYDSRYHQQLLGAMNEFINEQDRSGK